MKIHPHLIFGGRCREAFDFYQLSLGGEITTMLTWGASPMAAEVPTSWHSKICHATLTFGHFELTGVDDPFQPYQPPSGFQLLLDLEDLNETKTRFLALAEGGTILRPLEPAFWSPSYGLLVDRFGVRWEVNCSQAEIR